MADNKMAGRLLRALTIILVLVFLSLGLWILQKKNISKILFPSTSLGNFLPISPLNSAVVNATAFYTLNGEVEEVKNGKLKIKSSDELPEFSLDNKTPIFAVKDPTNQKAERVSLSALTRGKHILLVASFDYTNREWKIIRINIFPSSFFPQR